ncbi:hypothetical protein WA026_014189 [Henosepilachna vigintioctopunctata]|uniref:Uncharacterized protein n=1 Tax=Henosepilachna vigintioctopunctata TaxID=420089 RepID=A0AAW1TKI2_9CUCU
MVSAKGNLKKELRTGKGNSNSHARAGGYCTVIHRQDSDKNDVGHKKRVQHGNLEAHDSDDAQHVDGASTWDP